jgi:MFS family permease
LQDLTPNRMRARLSVLYLVAINFLGAMLGPTAIGWISDHWFQDPRKLPQAIALTCLIASPLAVLALWVGSRAYRRALIARSA